VLTVAVFATALASAQTCPSDAPLDWDNVTPVASSIWDETSGRAWSARKDGAQTARSAVPGRLRSLDGSVSGELNTDGESSLSEYTADAALTIQLGRLQGRQRARMQAEARALDAEARADKASYVYGVQEAFVAWRSAELERSHLQHYLAEATEALEPVRNARDNNLVTALDLADLEAEIVRVRAELTDAKQAADFARATLLARLGRDCDLSEQSAAELDIADMPALDDRENPWLRPIAQVDALPAVRAHRARIEATRAHASVFDAAEPLEMSIGAGVRSVGFNENFIVGTLGFTLPLARPGAMESVLASSEATAAEHNLDWLIQRSRADLRARADRYVALRASYQQYSGEVLAAMRERTELAEEALARGHIEMDRLILARRDLHEVFHRVVTLYTKIQAHHLRADALDAWLERTGSSDR
jgi:outer membrane protein TolC